MELFEKNPQYIAAAQDKIGHWYAFTGIPVAHPPTGRWILPFGGEAISLGLKPRTADHLSTLIVREDKIEEVAKKQAEYLEANRDKLAAARGETPSGFYN